MPALWYGLYSWNISESDGAVATGYSTVTVYIDDILITTETEAEYLLNPRGSLQTFGQG